jgi:hypothetical protein
MKTIIASSLLVFCSSSMAIDFDSMYKQFENDFNKLRNKGVVVQKVETGAPVSEGVLQRVDPKSPDRLGHSLSDPVMREKLQSLYNRDDVIVYSTTVR